MSQSVTMRSFEPSAGVNVMFIIQARNKVNADSRPNCTCVASVLPANTRKPEHRAIVLSVTGRSTADSALATRSEEHTSELQSLMRISYAVFCMKNKNHNKN